MELTEYITDLLVDFDEMGFAPTTTVPNPDAYAIEWRNKITKAIKELTEGNERLRKRIITLEQKLMLLGCDEVYVFKAQVKGE